MNILAIDCAVCEINIALQFGEKIISKAYDAQARQSEILIPAIDDILKKAEISVKDLDCTTLTIGPGSFTGLRLGISALKAMQAAYDIPIYPVSSLKAYSYTCENSEIPVLCCIDANKNRFYASLSDENNNVILQDGDYETEQIIEKLNFQKVLITGPGAKNLYDILKSSKVKTELILPNSAVNPAESLLKIAQQMINNKEKPLQDYNGPVYLRASEAELKLGK